MREVGMDAINIGITERRGELLFYFDKTVQSLRLVNPRESSMSLGQGTPSLTRT